MSSVYTTFDIGSVINVPNESGVVVILEYLKYWNTRPVLILAINVLVS